MNTYISAMIDGLNKKIEVLNDIHVKDEEQYALTKISPFPYDAFDKNAEEKSLLIYKLNKLDEGFELVYEKIREELSSDRDKYKEEIRTMQELITKVTDLSVQIQAEESRNKNAMECAFRDERLRLKNGRSSIKAVKSYKETMRVSTGYSGIWDEKK